MLPKIWNIVADRVQDASSSASFSKGSCSFQICCRHLWNSPKITLDDFKLCSYQICCRHLFFKVCIYFSITILVNYWILFWKETCKGASANMIWHGTLLAYAHCTPSLVQTFTGLRSLHPKPCAYTQMGSSSWLFPFSLYSVDYVDKQLTIKLRCIIYTYALF